MLKYIAAVALAAATLFQAAPSQAAGGYTGYYLATFKVPGGTFSHCFMLQRADGTVPGYKISGTWVDTDFPNTAGQFATFQHTLHLAGYVTNPTEVDYLVIDGTIASGSITNATFDLFTPTGMYLAAGSLTEMRNPACKP